MNNNKFYLIAVQPLLLVVLLLLTLLAWSEREDVQPFTEHFKWLKRRWSNATWLPPLSTGRKDALFLLLVALVVYSNLDFWLHTWSARALCALPLLVFTCWAFQFNRHVSLGTRSLLFGAHQFILHPIAVAIAWTRLYGAPLDPRLWVAFFVHDIGYWGCADLDGPQGSSHEQRGARIMGRLFGHKWAFATMCHSRRFCRENGFQPSMLCYADKLSLFYTPAWLWLLLTRLTGEIDYFMYSPHCNLSGKSATPQQWLWLAKQESRDWYASERARSFHLRCSLPMEIPV